jgi:hypothetical protein
LGHESFPPKPLQLIDLSINQHYIALIVKMSLKSHEKFIRYLKISSFAARSDSQTTFLSYWSIQLAQKFPNNSFKQLWLLYSSVAA